MSLCCKKHSSVQAREAETGLQPPCPGKQRRSSHHVSRVPLQLLLPCKNLLIWQEKWKIKIFLCNFPVLKCWYKCLKVLFKPGKIQQELVTLDAKREDGAELPQDLRVKISVRGPMIQEGWATTWCSISEWGGISAGTDWGTGRSRQLLFPCFSYPVWFSQTLLH